MTDVNKQLERAKKFLEKNRTEDAIDAYLAVLEDAPSHPEATQALGDLYARQEQPERAAVYYGMFFDLLIDPKFETKAKPARGSQRAIRQSRRAFYTGGPRRRRTLLSGAHGSAGAGKSFAAGDAGGGGGTEWPE